MAFGSNPTTGSQTALPSNQFPISTVAVPNAAGGNLTAIQGGPAATADANDNVLAPVSTYVYDGNNVAQGTTTDPAYSGSGAGTEIAILKKLVALFSAALTVSGTVTSNAGTNTSTAALALETGGNLALSKADLDAINTAIGAQSDAAYSGSGNGSEIALLKKIVAELAATLTISGTITANAGTGTMTVGQATGTNLHAVIDAGSAVIGHVIADSGSTTAVTSLPALSAGSNLIGGVELVDSAGTNKATISAGGAVKVDNSAVTQPVSGTFWQATQPVSGTVTSNIGTTNGLALDTSVNGVIVSQGSTTSGEKGPLVQGAVTASAPTYSNAQTSPISLTTAGAIRTDASATTQPVSGTVSITANGAVNVAQVAGTTTDTNSGVKSAGTQRVVLATDQPQLTNALKVDGSATTQPISGTISANQSGTWTVQPGNTANTTAWKVDGSAVTQPVSAASLPLPSGASTSAKQPAPGTAGSASIDVLSVQGIASMTALKTDGSGVTQPISGTVTSNAGTNLNTSALALESGHLATIDTSTAASKTDLDTIVTNTNKIPSNSVSATLQNAQAGNANGSTLNVLGMGSANFTVTMTGFSGSVIFEGSGDGTNFQSFSVNQQGTSFFSTIANGATTTSIVLYTCSVASLQLIRTRTSSVTAGTVTVTVEAVPAPWTFSTSTFSATQGTSPWTVNLIDGQAGVNLAGVDSSNRLKTIVSSALPAGTNVIGHIIADSGSTTAVTSLPALPAGTNVIGGITLPTSATGTLTSVAGSVSSSTQLLASNTSRKGMYVYNDSTAILYLGFNATVTTTSYTVQILANGFFEMPVAPIYTGVIAGVWSAANGNARITEMS